MEYITLGKIVKTIGLKGEVKIYSSSDFSYDRYEKGNNVTLFNEKTKERVTCIVKSFRKDKEFDIVSFEEFPSIEAITPYINNLVQIEKSDAILPKGFYHYSDLKNCDVYDENNNKLGKVKDVEEYASYQTLRIKREGAKDFFVPFVKTFIKKVDIDNKKIIIHVIEGLL